MCGFFFSAACSVCWSDSFQSILEGIPSGDYLALIRKASVWTSSDEQRQRAVIDAAINKIPESVALVSIFHNTSGLFAILMDLISITGCTTITENMSLSISYLHHWGCASV